jgi:UDP-N-acetylmuramoyl-tripeptide--D-alanyl-D-alanine ligase
LESLQQLARYHRQQLGTPIIGITGTNGKTTTKELIAAVLKQKFDLLYTQGNLNNHIGVPLTLLKLKHHHEIAIIEMGANHPGDIKLLAEIACPDYGIITNVGKAHLEGFGSFEGVMKTKSELYNYIESDGKLIFINKANPFLAQMAYDAKLTDGEKRCEYSLEGSDHMLFNYGLTSGCSPFL